MARHRCRYVAAQRSRFEDGREAASAPRRAQALTARTVCHAEGADQPTSRPADQPTSRPADQPASPLTSLPSPFFLLPPSPLSQRRRAPVIARARTPDPRCVWRPAPARTAPWPVAAARRRRSGGADADAIRPSARRHSSHRACEASRMRKADGHTIDAQGAGAPAAHR